MPVGEASLPPYASKFSRRDGYTLPQLFAMLAVRKFLGQDYRGMQVLLNERSDLRRAIGLTKVPDYSTLCLAETNRLDGVVDKVTLAMIRKVIRPLEKQRAGLIEAHDGWRNKCDPVQSVPGVGRRAPTSWSPTCRNWAA